VNKIIAMIPARIGSKRVPKKNLRDLNGKPLISYSIEAAIKSDVFHDIYINSDSDIFREIAEDLGVKFYKRPAYLGSDKTNNDDFAFDFIKNVEENTLIQLLPTSPLITEKEISEFVTDMRTKKYDTMISVLNHQIACIYNNKPVNFKLLEPHISSQEMISVQSYATVLMGWTYKSFVDNMHKYGFAYHGADSKIGYFTLKGLSEIDIDNEEDFELAEVALQYISNRKPIVKKYYESKKGKNRS
jgi:CMP-N-acetylneuraminic acid synthetase